MGASCISYTKKITWLQKPENLPVITFCSFNHSLKKALSSIKTHFPPFYSVQQTKLNVENSKGPPKRTKGLRLLHSRSQLQTAWLRTMWEDWRVFANTRRKNRNFLEWMSLSGSIRFYYMSTHHRKSDNWNGCVVQRWFKKVNHQTKQFKWTLKIINWILRGERIFIKNSFFKIKKNHLFFLSENFIC